MKHSLVALFVAATCASQAGAAPTRKHVLPNGLTVLVREDHSAPVVAVRFSVKTGSIYEGKYLGAGLSHLFEHTLSEGTTTRAAPQIEDELEAIGGVNNASTSYDETEYHVTTVTPYFNRALGVLTDMMRHANFPRERVEQEQGVIHNEMDDEDTWETVTQLWNATAFQVHPARFPVIGFRAQFDALSRDDILAYYRDRYTPENTVLSVAGDVSDAQVMKGVQKELADWPRRAAHAPVVPPEPLQSAPRRAEQTKDVTSTYLQVGWHTVPVQSPDAVVLDVLEHILDGDKGRLNRQLHDKEHLVSSVMAESDTPNYDAGTFSVAIEIAGVQFGAEFQAKVQAALAREIERVRTTSVSEDELARAKKSLRLSFLFGKEGVDDEAEDAATNEMAMGDPDYAALYSARLQKVTAAQVQAVAQKYLRPEGTTTVSIHPPRTPATPATPALGAQPSAPMWRVSFQKTAPSATMTTLPNGVRLIVKRVPGSATVSIVTAAAGGLRFEDPAKAGVASVTADLLTLGTARQDAEQFAASIENLGGSLDGTSSGSSCGLTSRWLSSDWRAGLSLVAQAWLSPTFAEDQLQDVKEETLQKIADQDDDPRQAAFRLMFSLAFGSHPLARSENGTEATVRALSRADVVAYWNSVLQPRQTVVTVVGDVDPAQVQQAARELFGSFQAKVSAPKAPPAIVPPTGVTTGTTERKTWMQSVIVYGFPGASVSDPDRFSLAVLDAALSGAHPGAGRIFLRLRREKLVYEAGAVSVPTLDGGLFAVYAVSTPQNRARVRQIIEEELTRARDTTLSPDELARAKTMCIAAQAIGLQTPAQQASDFARNELLGLGFGDSQTYAARISAVTGEQVQRAAQKYLDLNHAAVVTASPS